MQNNHSGLPLQLLFNWERLFQSPITDVPQFHMIKHHPYVYVFKKSGQEFELSRGYSLRYKIWPIPWRISVIQVRVNRFILDEAIKELSVKVCQDSKESVQS